MILSGQRSRSSTMQVISMTPLLYRWTWNPGLHHFHCLVLWNTQTADPEVRKKVDILSFCDQYISIIKFNFEIQFFSNFFPFEVHTFNLRWLPPKESYRPLLFSGTRFERDLFAADSIVSFSLNSTSFTFTSSPFTHFLSSSRRARRLPRNQPNSWN